ncbi:MAG TPA: hypothetical protein VF244_03225, partial [Acidimicrobiales bacterium]
MRLFSGMTLPSWMRGRTAVLLAVGLVALGTATGFSATRPFLGDGSAWLENEQGVAHVNAGTGRPDATVQLPLQDHGDDVGIVDASGGPVIVMEGQRGTGTPVDPVTMQPGQAVDFGTRPGLGGEPAELLLSGDRAYVTDPGGRRVLLVNATSPTLNVLAAVPLGAALRGAVADGVGGLWVLLVDGRVVHVVGDQSSEPLRVAAEGNAVSLSALGDGAVVVDATDHVVTQVSAGGTSGTPIPAEIGPGDQVQRPSAATDGAIWFADHSPSRLIGVDLRGGRSKAITLDVGTGDPRFTHPVATGGRVFVVELTTHTLFIADIATGQVEVLDVDGNGHDVELFEDDGLVWASDPTSPLAWVVDADGESHRVDLRTGEAIQQAAPVEPESPAPVAPQP